MTHERRIWRILAFLGRYGHQPVTAMLDLTLVDLRELQEFVGDLIDDEGKSVRAGMEGG